MIIPHEPTQSGILRRLRTKWKFYEATLSVSITLDYFLHHFRWNSNSRTHQNYPCLTSSGMINRFTRWLSKFSSIYQLILKKKLSKIFFSLPKLNMTIIFVSSKSLRRYFSKYGNKNSSCESIRRNGYIFILCELSSISCTILVA